MTSQALSLVLSTKKLTNSQFKCLMQRCRAASFFSTGFKKVRLTKGKIDPHKQVVVQVIRNGRRRLPYKGENQRV